MFGCLCLFLLALVTTVVFDGVFLCLVDIGCVVLFFSIDLDSERFMRIMFDRVWLFLIVVGCV